MMLIKLTNGSGQDMYVNTSHIRLMYRDANNQTTKIYCGDNSDLQVVVVETLEKIIELIKMANK